MFNPQNSGAENTMNRTFRKFKMSRGNVQTSCHFIGDRIFTKFQLQMEMICAAVAPLRRNWLEVAVGLMYM